MNEAALTQLLNAYFNARDLQPSVPSPTEAAIRRAKARGANYSECSKCEGTGSERLGGVDVPCLSCGGAKRVPRYGLSGWLSRVSGTVRCPACRGTCKAHRREFLAAGYLDPNPVNCWLCDGAGYRAAQYATPSGADCPVVAEPRETVRSSVHRFLDGFRWAKPDAYAVLELVYGQAGQRSQINGKLATEALIPRLKPSGYDPQILSAMLHARALWELEVFDTEAILHRYVSAVQRRGVWKEGIGSCRKITRRRKSYRWSSTQ